MLCVDLLVYEQAEVNENDDEVDVSCSKTEFQIKQEAHERLKELVDKYAKDDDFFFDDDDFEEEDDDEWIVTTQWLLQLTEHTKVISVYLFV